MKSKTYRYPGSKPFSPEDSLIYFGRSGDIDSLFKYVNVENLVVLYGKSGLGKSSLLNAGLLARLQEKDFFPIPIRFNNYIKGSDTCPLKITEKKILSEKTCQSFLNQIENEQISLWQHLKSIEICENKPVRFVLIFDQFEELFTFPEGISDFAQQLADLIDRRIPKPFQEKMNLILDQDEDFLTDEQMRVLMQPLQVKVLLSIRSDKLNLLNSIRNFIPNILQNCYELLPFNSQQAKDAIVKPAMQKGNFVTPNFVYAPDALTHILDFLTNHGKQHVETFQLQMLCQYIEQSVVQEKNKTIVEKHDVNDLDYLVENYYEYQINLICQDETEKKQLTHLIEDGLIFEQEEQRLSLFVGQIRNDYKISEALLARLVDSRLIRAEIGSTGGTYYELSHDTLVEPILKAKNKRREEIKKQELEAQKQAEILRISQEKEEKNKRRFWRAIAVLGAAFCGVVAGFSVVLHFKNKDLERNFMEISRQAQRNEQLTDSLRILSREIGQMYDTDVGKLQREIQEMEKELRQIRKEKALTASDENAQKERIKKVEQELLEMRAKYQLKEREHEQRQDDFKRLNRELENALYKNIRNQKEFEKLRDGILQKYIELERKF